MEELKDYDFYKLVCKTDENIYYIGSTSNMNRRFRTHKASTNNPNNINHNSKTYSIIRDNGGWDNFKFIIVHNVKNLTKREAHQTEQEFINLFKPNMNTYNSYVSKEQRKQNNVQNGKEYYQENKEKNNIDCKKYRETHKEEISAQHKEYYEKNKEKIKEKRKEKMTCECGCIVVNQALTRHKKSIKHLILMDNKSQSDN